MKKQRLISLLILLALLLSMGSVCVLAEDDTQENVSDGPFEVDAKAAILIDMNTGRTIYEKNIDERIYPASLTKIMTCLLALENGNLSDIVTIDEGAFTGLDGNSSTAGLQVGERRGALRDQQLLRHAGAPDCEAMRSSRRLMTAEAATQASGTAADNTNSRSIDVLLSLKSGGSLSFSRRGTNNRGASL